MDIVVFHYKNGNFNKVNDARLLLQLQKCSNYEKFKPVQITPSLNPLEPKIEVEQVLNKPVPVAIIYGKEIFGCNHKEFYKTGKRAEDFLPFGAIEYEKNFLQKFKLHFLNVNDERTFECKKSTTKEIEFFEVKFDGSNIVIEERLSQSQIAKKFYQSFQMVGNKKAPTIHTINNNKEAVQKLSEQAYHAYLWSTGPCNSDPAIFIAQLLYPELKNHMLELPLIHPESPKSMMGLFKLFDAVPEAKEKFLHQKGISQIWDKIIEDFSTIEKQIKKDHAINGNYYSEESFNLMENLNKITKKEIILN